MRKFKIVSMIIVVMFLVSGCALMDKVPTKDSPCVGVEPADSYICGIVSNPQEADFLLRLANVGALEADLYTANAALKTVDMLIAVVEDGQISYSDLVKIIIKDVSPLVFVVVEEYSGKFLGIQAYLTPKDIEMIIYHLKRQRALISMAILTGSRNLNTFREVG